MKTGLYPLPVIAVAVGMAAFASSVAAVERTVPAVSLPTRDASTAAKPRPVVGGERAEITVMVDRAKVIRLPEATRTVVVGNPAIADVGIQKSGIVVVTGKSYGETNLIALDAVGNMLAESTLIVQGTNQAIVTVQRGLERQSYSCTPSCMPSVQLGDAAPYYGSTKDQALQHSQFSGQR
jgi:Flp pilus assembly secretin CpaC